MADEDPFSTYLRQRHGVSLPPAAPMAKPKVTKEEGDAQVSTAKGQNAPRREHAETVDTEMSAEEKRLKNQVTAATADAQIKEAQARADKAVADAEAAKRSNRYGGVPPEKVAEFKGNVAGLDATRKKLDDLRAQYLAHFRGKGPIQSTAEMLPPKLRPANGVFDDTAGGLLTTAAQTQGLTSRQFDTPGEQKMFLAPLVPKSSDTDEQIEHKLAMWDDMINGASHRYGAMLGMRPEDIAQLAPNTTANMPSPGLRWLTDEQEQATNAYANGPNPTAQGYADLMERFAHENGKGFNRDEALRVGATIEERRKSGKGFGPGVTYVNHSPVPTEGTPEGDVRAPDGSQPSALTLPHLDMQMQTAPGSGGGGGGGIPDMASLIGHAALGPLDIFTNPNIQEAGRNLPSSAGSFVKNTAEGVGDTLSQPAPLGVDTHLMLPGLPDQAADLFYKLGNSALGAMGITNADPTLARVIGHSYAERYGGIDRATETFRKDPVGFLADASTVLSGIGGATIKGADLIGQTSRAAKVANTAGRVVQTAGRMADPVSLAGGAVEGLDALTARYLPNARSAVGTTLSHLTQKYPAAVAAIPSGIGGETIEEAVGAGRQRSLQGPNARSAAFTGQMRGSAPPEDIMQQLEQGMQNLRNTASARYKQDIAPITQDKTQLDFQPVIDRVMKLRPRTFGLYTGKASGDEAAWASINDQVQQHAALIAQDPATYTTPEALDAFKQRLYDTAQQFAEGNDKSASRIANGAYSAVKGVIEQQAPDYAKVMRDYATAQEHMSQIRRSLTSGGARPVYDASIRRLQSILRRNDPGYAGQLIDDVDANPNTNLRASVAGRDASSFAPDRFRAAIGSGMALDTGLASLPFEWADKIPAMEPTQLAALALLSPRITGEMSYGLGRGIGLAERGARGAWDTYSKNPEAVLGAANAARMAEIGADDRQRRSLLKRYGISADDETQNLIDKYAGAQ